MPNRPLVIAHRGASGYRPEHTLAAYRLAIRQGADYIEPDLVSTKDGVLVVRHENELSATTDVARRAEFRGHRTSKTVDGRTATGWFVEDFTLAELKTLRARERRPALRPASARHDGRYAVPTFQEVIDLARRATRSTGRTIGLYPETKHPSYFDSIGLSLEQPLVRTLRRNGFTRRSAPVFIQSFETGNLRELATMTRLRLVQLLDARTRLPNLADIARYAAGVGVHKNLVVPRTRAGDLLAPTTLVRDAHHEGLQVHAWTVRAENAFLPRQLRVGREPGDHGDFRGECDLLLRLGVDGLFTDHPDLAVAVRRDVSFGRAAG